MISRVDGGIIDSTKAVRLTFEHAGSRAIRVPFRAGLLVLLFGPLASSARGQDTVAVTIRTLIAGAQLPMSRWPDFGRQVDDVARLYASRADAPLWLDGGRLTRPAHEAIVKLSAVGEHGLDPRDYDASTLDSLARRLTAASLPAGELARFDLLLTVAMVRCLDDLTTGRLRGAPFERARGARLDIAAALSGALRGGSVARLVDASAPRLTQYRNLQRQLSGYRRLAADTTLPTVHAARPVQPGDAYAEVADLRARLRATGDRVGDDDSPRIYGAHDVDAVRRFQRRHALAPDARVRGTRRSPLSIRHSRIGCTRSSWRSSGCGGSPARRRPDSSS